MAHSRTSRRRALQRSKTQSPRHPPRPLRLRGRLPRRARRTLRARHSPHAPRSPRELCALATPETSPWSRGTTVAHGSQAAWPPTTAWTAPSVSRIATTDGGEASGRRVRTGRLEARAQHTTDTSRRRRAPAELGKLPPPTNKEPTRGTEAGVKPRPSAPGRRRRPPTVVA